MAGLHAGLVRIAIRQRPCHGRSAEQLDRGCDIYSCGYTAWDIGSHSCSESNPEAEAEHERADVFTDRDSRYHYGSVPSCAVQAA
ncbi:hypothetical protein D3C72_2001380 [compost metagenome]